MRVYPSALSVGSARRLSSQRAFSRADMLVALGAVALLAACALPLLAATRPQQHLSVCANNLRLIGQGFLSFAETHGDKFPPSLQTIDGGALFGGSAAFLFRPLSNDLASPRILVCPSSVRRSASSVSSLLDINLSYFYGAHAAADRSQEILSGDMDILSGTSATCSYVGNSIVTAFQGSVGVPDTFIAAWSATNHIASGNLLLSDGSVSGGDSRHLKRKLADSAREGGQPVHVLNPQ